MRPQGPGRSPDRSESIPGFLQNTLHCHQLIQAFRKDSHWCLKGPCQPGVLSLPAASPGLLAQGLLGTPWPLRPYGFGRGDVGPPLAWQSSRGESCGPAASFHPFTHESSFLPLQQTHTCTAQAAGSPLLHHSAVPVMKAVGTVFSAGLLSMALGFERSEFESYLCHFLATWLHLNCDT